MALIWIGWSDGKRHYSGEGYGITIPIADRDRYFKQEWESILLQLPGAKVFVTINVDQGVFWNTKVPTLVSKDVGNWLIKTGFAPWVKGKPPTFGIDVEDRFFRVLSVRK